MYYIASLHGKQCRWRVFIHNKSPHGIPGHTQIDCYDVDQNLIYMHYCYKYYFSYSLNLVLPYDQGNNNIVILPCGKVYICMHVVN